MSDDEKRRWRGPGGESQPSSPRALTQRPTARRDVKASSRAWIERQLNDPYVKRAQAEGYRSRAAYKLMELAQQFDLGLRPGARVIDLGAAPGGWLQVAQRNGVVGLVGIDVLPIAPLPGAVLIEGDVADPAVVAEALATLRGTPDVVLSDMAANTTGHARTDQIRTGALAEAAARFALAHLAPGGAFVTKAFQGGLDSALLHELKQNFVKVQHAKPKASRAESKEIYLVALQRRASSG
jgi:23S rRNA (uridine2552-2'-O)-methyltransferase